MEHLKCKCYPENIITDEKEGIRCCAECGQVVEQSCFVSELQFVNNKLLGNFIGNGIDGQCFLKSKYGNSIYESRELRLKKAFNIIQQIAGQLALTQKITDSAKNLYNLASTKHRFIQGRKTRHVCGVILYISCRNENSPHLLIDFSDVLQTNLYILGSIYLKLIQILKINLVPIDPSLFIHRFCAKLEFKEKTREVSSTSMRILQSMKRDWMSTGRRPSGLCGAAILIASRIHNFKRTTQQIVEVVNVCDETIKKRVEEFSNTEVAKLTKTEFDKFDITSENGRDPPSFLKKNKKIVINENLANQIDEKAKEIDDIIYNDKDKCTITKKIKNDIEIDQGKHIPASSESLETNKKLKKRKRNSINSVSNANIPSGNAIESIFTSDIYSQDKKKDVHTETTLIITKNYKSDKDKVDDNSDLSDLDDQETKFFLLTNEEYKLKKMLWEVLNKDWIEDQRNKVKKETKKRKRKMITKPENIVAKTPLEAIKNSKFAKKMNPSVLTKLFDEKLVK